MKELDYALALFQNFPVSHHDREDSLEKVLSLMAFQEVLSDNEENFSYIISHSRFNDYCLRGLFVHFFTYKFKDENQISNAHKYFKNLLVQDLFDFPLIFEREQKNGLPPLHKNIEAWTMFLEKLNKEKIYLHDLYKLMENIFYYEQDIPKKYKNFHKQYNQYLLHQESTAIVNNLVYTLGNSSTSVCSKMVLDDYKENSEEMKKAEYVYNALSNFEHISTNKEKQQRVLELLAIGLYQSKKNNIGERRKVREYKNRKLTIGYPSTPYIDTIPLCFNTPYKEFYQCLDIFNDIKKCGFSEPQKKKIADLYFSIHKKLY